MALKLTVPKERSNWWRGSSTTDSSIGGVAGEAQDIGGISSDPSVATESPVDEGSTEGLGTGLSSL